MDEDSTPVRLDQMEAWVAQATAAVEGLKTQVRPGSRNRKLGKQLRKLRDEAAAQLRRLDDIALDVHEEEPDDSA